MALTGIRVRVCVCFIGKIWELTLSAAGQNLLILISAMAPAGKSAALQGV